MTDTGVLQAELAAPAPLEPHHRPAQSFLAESLERLRANRVGMAAGFMILFFALVAVTAPWLANSLTHFDPNRQTLRDVFQGPSGRHWVGTDELGRDLFTRLIYGAQVSYGVAFLTIAISTTIGSSIGILAGFYGGVLDRLLMRFVDMLLSVPTLYLLILFSVLQPVVPFTSFHLKTSQPATLAVIIAILGWGGLARLVRGQVLGVKHRDFILATRSLGASDVRLMTKHILPNVTPIIIIAASLGVGGIILAEAALDFIGLGILPPTASWGNMLSNAQSYLYHGLWLVLAPGVLIFVAVLSFNLFGNAVRDAFDPRLK